LAEIGNETSQEVSSINSSDVIHYGSRAERKKAERSSFGKAARSAKSSSRSNASRGHDARVAVVSSEVAVSRPSVTKNEAPRNASRTINAKRVAMRRRASGAIVMTVAAGVISTFALPAYAINPSVGSVDPSTFVIPQGTTQSLYVAATAAGSTARDSFSATGAAPVAAANAYAGSTSRSISVDVSGIASNSALLSAALSLVGRSGDCTSFVEASLQLLGYSAPFGSLGPMQFGRFGTEFYDPSQVQPGDIMMRSGHVAIYAGPGLAAQGGIGYMSYLTSTASNPAEYQSFVRVG